MKNTKTVALLSAGAAMFNLASSANAQSEAPNAVPATMAPSFSPSTCSREQEAANKALILSILSPDHPPSPDAIMNAMHPDYIQHNPDAARFAEINHLHGRDAMVKMKEAFDVVGHSYAGPPPGKAPPPNFNKMMIAECDRVAVMRETWLPDPQNPGKFYAAYNTEIYRIKDGKLYEHWDDVTLTNPVPEYLTAPLDELKRKHGK